MAGALWDREKIAARSAAKERGEKVFFITRPCRNGHLGPWKVADNYCVACTAAANAKWRASKLDERKKVRRDYYRSNRDRELATSAAWAAANRDVVNVIERNRRARKKNSMGQHTAEDIAAIRRAQRNKCAYCRGSVKGSLGHADHIIPLALGGGNGRENLQMLCQPCNSAKWALHPIDFAQRIGRLL